jgi:Xaa-Pro aminopeptidase
MNFTREEYNRRLKKVKKSMSDKGIDLLICQDPSNINYLTGYDAWSFYYAQCVIVHLNLDEPICFIRNQDVGGAYIKTFLKKENIVEYEEKYIHSWPLHPYDALVDLLKQKKWTKLCIGLEMDSHYFTAYCYEKIKKGLPDAKILDCERLVNWVRFIKSEPEIKFMRAAAKISQLGMSKAFEVINPGVRQCDAVSEIFSTLIKGTSEYGGDYSSIVPMLPTGKGTSASHLTWSEEKFINGEATIIELSRMK